MSGFLQNLTEFNTAHNKRISTLTIEEGNLEIQRPKRKRRSSRVSFSEEEEIINPGTHKRNKEYICTLLSESLDSVRCFLK